MQLFITAAQISRNHRTSCIYTNDILEIEIKKSVFELIFVYNVSFMLRKIYHCVVLVLSIFHTGWGYICTYNMRTNLHTMLSVWLCLQLDAAVFEYFACNLLAIYVCHVLRENVTCIGMWLIMFFFYLRGCSLCFFPSF